MAFEEAHIEAIQYRLVLVLPDSRKILSISVDGSYRLPKVYVPQWTRPAEQLRKACRTVWNQNALILDLWPSRDDASCYAVAELLSPNLSHDLSSIAFEELPNSELTEEYRTRLARLLSGRADGPFSQLGWIDEAITWVESATQQKVSSKSSIDQLNAGGTFSLVRFRTEGGCEYWLKATGDPNAHEYSITCLLSTLGGRFLPRLISTKPSWNAWLMSGEATVVTELPSDPFKLFQLLDNAVGSMAELQMTTVGHRAKLLNAGAFDQGMQVLKSHSEALFDYLEEAMAMQTSTKAPRLDSRRLHEICKVLEECCHRMDDLGLPETILHGNLNHGNILAGPGHCQFIDWCEGYIGNPLITLEHLLLLNKVENPHLRGFINQLLRQCYLDSWSKITNAAPFEAAFVYMPFLAIVSSLVGRGNWLNSPKRNDPRCQANARSLARHMARAAREPGLMEALTQ